MRATVLRQPDAHQRAAAFTCAARPDPAVVLLDDIATDEQAQAHAGDLALLGIARSTEWLEDPFGGFWRQADAAILDLQQHAARLSLHPNAELGTVGRVLERVVEQIVQHLLDPIWIGRDQRRRAEDLERELAV